MAERMEKNHPRIVDIGADLRECAGLIRACFAGVAGQFGLTPSNCPSHPAFLKTDKLVKMRAEGARFLGLTVDDRLAGLVSVRLRERLCYIEKLCVLPEHRHRGFGKRLMEAAEDYAREHGCQRASIGIIDENKVLKDWYVDMGFRVTDSKRYGRLPFTVCMMEKTL